MKLPMQLLLQLITIKKKFCVQLNSVVLYKQGIKLGNEVAVLFLQEELDALISRLWTL